MASLRHRRGIAEAEDYSDDDSAAGTDDNATEEGEEEEEEDHRMHLGLHSMTAKGIQHLCSELLEIKKASEQDFRANVYLSYLSFIMVFQEAGGDLDKDVHRLKRQVMAHRRLIQHLTTNRCFYSIPMLLGSGSNCSIRKMVAMMDGDKNDEEDLELDVLLSEHRMEQALELLELQGQALHSRMQQQQQEEVTTGSSTSSSSATADDEAEEEEEEEEEAAMVIASRIRALSARKARVADRLASVAENPRTPRPELLKALSGLCRLGDAERANHLLFKYHSHRAETERTTRQGQGQSQGVNYIKDLARMVLSSIAQASRGFVALHGHPSPYTPQLVRWAREEMEDLGDAFTEFVRSMPGPGSSSCLALALEAAECAISSSYSSLLKRLDVVATEQDVVRLVAAPGLREAVAMYGRHLKEVVRLLVASDAQAAASSCTSTSTLTFLTTMPQQVVADEQQYCLLTSSGRKFVTLIQEVLEDVARPLLRLGMTNEDDDDDDPVALQLVAELFREYMHSIVELITTIPATGKEEDVGEEKYYMWQISILINCTTLVSLFPRIIIASGISSTSSSISMASDSSSSSSSADADADAAAQTQRTSRMRQQQAVDSLVSLIKGAAGQVWSCFCQHFIRDTIVLSTASSAGAPPPTPPQQGAGMVMMPSPAFQTVFLRVRRLTKHATPMADDAGTTMSVMMKRLLQELMEAIISWLSGNLDSWVHQQQLQLQLQLDVHFLLELAQFGGFSSDKMRSSALELLRRAQEMMSQQEVEDEGFAWAADAAKQAVQALLIMGGSEQSGQHAAAAAATTSAPEEEEEEDDEDESGGGAAAKSSDELFISIEDEEEEDAKAAAAADTS